MKLTVFTGIIVFAATPYDDINSERCRVIYLGKILQHIILYDVCVKLRFYLMDNEIMYLYCTM
jgi:hypothetical protein